jgi:GNAT superfamily N-acetyltransferase
VSVEGPGLRRLLVSLHHGKRGEPYMEGKHSMTSLAPEIHVGRAPLSSILECRTRVLRPHFAAGQLAHFEGDDEPGTWHGALWAHGEVVGCVTMMRRQWEKGDEAPQAWSLAHDRTWQLRGMAVNASYRGQGYGATPARQLLACMREQGLRSWATSLTSP